MTPHYLHIISAAKATTNAWGDSAVCTHNSRSCNCLTYRKSRSLIRLSRIAQCCYLRKSGNRIRVWILVWFLVLISVWIKKGWVRLILLLREVSGIFLSVRGLISRGHWKWTILRSSLRSRRLVRVLLCRIIHHLRT